MSTAMRAKMVVYGVAGTPDAEGKVHSENLSMRAVCKSDGYPADGSDENNSFARWTPMAGLTMTINNPELIGKFKAGDMLYVDFTPVK